jgi:molecular chaperone GrpE
LDETAKEQLLNQLAVYLDGLADEGSGKAPAAVTRADTPEESDLFSVFVELAGLRNEVRTESRLVKEALDRFRAVFDTLQTSHGTLEQELKRLRAEIEERERALLKPLLLDVIEVRDRVAAGLKPGVPSRPQWYARFLRSTKQQTDAAWREGMQMTLRRIDRLLADRRVVAAETIGRPFDPRLAAAVATVADAAAADGTVVEEVRTGFLWQGELLRPAEVIVARRDVPSGDGR